ncbi:MAG: hypothetical protein EP344_13100 [Bacteroidetes bacterium]|nr:MAG: hypothetical protein EP344_13100 [Bacteroidota bacterium]
MKTQYVIAGILALALVSCQQPGSETGAIQSHAGRNVQVAGLELELQHNPEWEYANLRLYPITAGEQVLNTNAGLPVLTTLAEGMELPGFRITERKQFGRERDPWYNALTVQNKSTETIFLMAGDVVTGGNQDRVIAQDDIIPPGTIKQIAVFCVEAGRSSYYDPEAPEAEKQIAAFRGYYNVASPQVRKAVFSGNQQNVWNAVESVTSANAAFSDTKAYAALDTENEQKTLREGYLRFFEGKFANRPNTVGVVAVSAGEVIAVDIFGRPELFRQHYMALLHGYAAEAATTKTATKARDQAAIADFRLVATFADKNKNSSEAVGKLTSGTSWVHLYKK